MSGNLLILSLCTMAEERPAKLKLKRRKCMTTAQGAQEADVEPPSMPAVNVRRSSAGSWFDEIDLTTAEQLWKQVLSCVSPDLRSVGWGSVPALPDFTHQVAEQGQKTTVIEVFEVGQKSFEWFPFPPAVTEPRRSTDPRHETGRSNEQLAEPVLSKPHNHFDTVNHMEISLMVPGSTANDRVGNKNSTEEPSGPTKNVKESMAFLTSSKDHVKAPLAAQKSSTKRIKTPQSLRKGLADHVKDPQTSQKRSKKPTEGPRASQKGAAKNVREPPTLPKQTVHLWPTVTSTKNSKAKEGLEQAEPPAQSASECNDDMMDIEEPVSASGNGLQVIQESADKATEAAGSLDSCPICLMQFPKQFSQLDVDSHLAQCLSETTVDVVW